MEKKVTSLSNALFYGGITTLAVIIYSLLLMVLNVTSGALTNLTYLLIAIGAYLGNINFRDKALDGNMSFGKALGHSMFIVAIVSVISSLFMAVYLSIDSSIINLAIEQTEESMAEQNMDEEQMEMALSYTRKFMTPVWMSVFMLLAYLFFGFILSLIIAAITKKENPNATPFDTAS